MTGTGGMTAREDAMHCEHCGATDGQGCGQCPAPEAKDLMALAEAWVAAECSYVQHFTLDATGRDDAKAAFALALRAPAGHVVVPVEDAALLSEAVEYLENAAIVSANRSGPSHDPENKRQWTLAQAIRRRLAASPTIASAGEPK